MKKILFLSFFIFIFSHIQAQQLPEMDSVDMLLTNMAIQIECTAGVNDLYNFKFSRAESQFGWLRRKYPNHPLPYFLMGLSNWWKIVPNIDIEKYDAKFLAYMDTSITKAEGLYDKNNKNPEAAFFLAAAYGFKGRLFAERKQWTKATFAGKNAIKYMEKAIDKSDLSIEFLFGDGLYNYFAEWIPQNYKFLKPVLWFFRKGDRKKGLEQLEKVASDAFYTKTEAQYFLMRIYPDEKMIPKAFEMSKYLYRTFPDNAYFHRYYARMLYTNGDMRELEPIALDMISKIDSSRVGYEEISGRYASFFLGHIYRIQGHKDKAKQYYQRTIQFSEKIKSLDAGYYHYAMAELAHYADSEGNISLAKQYYEKIKEHTEKDNILHKEAKEYLKKNKKRS
ncbi:MAG: tol-pal system protein YbgF [Thermoflexibacter sp.]|jgi:tetratricopeptide (TPR) repeat protein|nr:tol-pal system protein YbgF [Thermoflexibacter sp.]